METKEELRHRLLAWRCALTPVQRTEWSRQITCHILDWPVYQGAQTIHCFRSMEATGEVETGPLIDRMLQEGKQVVLPRTIPDGMESVRIQSDTSYVRHPLGMEEPVAGEVIPSREIDLVLVPMLAADRGGQRLGYGKGMYDRFLHTIHGVTAGLLYSSLLQASPLPSDPHDIPMDWLVSEETIMKSES